MGSGNSGYGIHSTRGSYDMGYAGGADHLRSLEENLGIIGREFMFREGYFGKPGSHGKSKVRVMESDDPASTAKRFYESASFGGIERPIYENPTGDGQLKIRGWTTELAGKCHVTFRPVSKSPDGSPAVDIVIGDQHLSGGIKSQKIHFVDKKEG